MSKLDLLQELKARYGTTPAAPAAQPAAPATSVPGSSLDLERAFVTHAASGRTVITAPLREVANTNEGFTYLRGRLVGADTPNDNGALWTTDDLRMGEATVAGGPLNWLHDDSMIVGCLLDGQLVAGREAAASGLDNHIVSTAAVWRFLYPEQTKTIERAAADGQLFYSMECLSREVACIDTPGRPGCGESFAYGDYDAGRCCSHLRERSSVRQFVDPLFLGAAVIVPPVRPGWAQASVDIVREAAALSERAGLDQGHLTGAQARDLAAAVLTWANR